MTVLDLKYGVASIQRILPDQQGLIHAGKPMEDTRRRRLAGYGVLPGATVYMVVRKWGLINNRMKGWRKFWDPKN
eukprot:jgi/Botrbrau1/2743/Bobra.0164s0023.1